MATSTTATKKAAKTPATATIKKATKATNGDAHAMKTGAKRPAAEEDDEVKAKKARITKSVANGVEAASKAKPALKTKASTKVASKPKAPAKAKADTKPKGSRKSTAKAATEEPDTEEEEVKLPQPLAAEIEKGQANPKPKPKPAALAESTKAESTVAGDRSDDETVNGVAGELEGVGMRATPPPAPAAPSKFKVGAAINLPPTKKLDIFVFGEGTSGELGLGNERIDGKKPINVMRPRLNPKLLPDDVGVVYVATGGMHVAALTYDNRIYTWGVNDQGALGRSTQWSGGLVDVEETEEQLKEREQGEMEGAAMNPRECTPGLVDPAHFPEGTIFTQLVASDSATFALTADGSVYGWGTFRSNDGILGFNDHVLVQQTPLLVDGLKKIKSLAAGANHIVALNDKGTMFAWGSGQQNQLGRRVVERNKAGLAPREFGLRNKIDSIWCGSYHSFAIDKRGDVWSWGLNSYGETGHSEEVTEETGIIVTPKLVQFLRGRDVIALSGGAHHSVAATEDGKVLVWGRCDGGQCGVDLDDLNKEVLIYDERDKPRIIREPVTVPDIQGAVDVEAGPDHTLAVTKDGKVYSWGFSANYQTGQGSDDDVEVAEQIDNSAIREKKILGARAGGQFGILFSAA